MRRGKSETPVPSVETDDSRKESEVRREETQSPYVGGWPDVLVAIFDLPI